ncbi:hypothetical protein HP532_28630, partial [Pseudomonas sp. CrR25]|nr:hypothetical protein [Pseudomonas sp. CrR25]
MAWPWFMRRPQAEQPAPPADAWARHVAELHAHGLAEPGTAHGASRPATQADEQALYNVAPSFADQLPWAEYL